MQFSVEVGQRLLEQRAMAPIAGALEILEGARARELQGDAPCFTIPLLRRQLWSNGVRHLGLGLGDLILD